MKLLYGDLEYPTSIEIRGHQPHVNICKDKLTCKFGAKRRYTEPGVGFCYTMSPHIIDIPVWLEDYVMSIRL